MATETIYNPLIKKGFQEITDVGTIQAELADLQERLTAAQNAINALQGNKVTKITDSAQLSTIEDNEIFQWQTIDATIDGTSFKNGYFYKCTTNSITLPTGTQYFDNDFDVVNLYGYDVRIGSYYIIEDNTPAAGNDYYYFRVMAYTDSPDYIFFNYTFPTVGEAVWNRANNEVVTVVSVDENLTLHLSDGHTVTTANSSWSHPYKIYKVLSDYGEYFNVCSCPQMNVYIFLPDYVVNGNTFTVNDYFTIQHSYLLETVEPTEIGQNTYAQTNTQQQQLSLLDNVPVYTLSDETTQINLVSEDTISDTPVDFPAAAVTGNIADGEALGTMAKKIFNFVNYFNFFSPDSRTFLTQSIPLIDYSVIGNSQNLYDNLLPTTATFISYIANFTENPSHRDGFIIVFKNGKYGIMFILSNGGNIYKRYVDNGTFSAWTLI